MVNNNLSSSEIAGGQRPERHDRRVSMSMMLITPLSPPSPDSLNLRHGSALPCKPAGFPQSPCCPLETDSGPELDTARIESGSEAKRLTGTAIGAAGQVKRACNIADHVIDARVIQMFEEIEGLSGVGRSRRLCG